MTKHSKNNTASSIFSYAEYKKLDYGTKRQRLGNESMRRFDACALCLNSAREPVACNKGHLFCKECVYSDLLTQKKDAQRQKAKLEALTQEAEEEKARAREAARERVLLEFERGQRGLVSSAASSSSSPLTAAAAATTAGASGSGISGTDNSDARAGTKRKFDFDTSAVETLAREAEEAALRQIEREQADALRNKLPDFWLPSLTPTYTTTGPPQSLKDVKIQTTCRGGNPTHPIALKNLFPVKFTYFENGKAEAKGREGADHEPMCPSCKKHLSNNLMLFVMKPCAHVTCKTCTDSLVRPARQCIVCDQVLQDKDIIELRREGTGFAGGGMAETSKVGVAFQG